MNCYHYVYFKLPDFLPVYQKLQKGIPEGNSPEAGI